MNLIFLVLFVCLGTSWAQENDTSLSPSERANRISRAASALADQISQNASGQANQISRESSARANTIQYQPPMYGGGYGYGGYGGNWGQPQPVYQIQQNGSVAIAQSARVTVDPVDCLKTAKEALGSADKAATYCQKLFDREAKRSEKVANEAADATKSSRPLIMVPMWR